MGPFAMVEGIGERRRGGECKRVEERVRLMDARVW